MGQVTGLNANENGLPTQFNRVRRNEIVLHGDPKVFPFSGGFPEPDPSLMNSSFDLTGILLIAQQRSSRWAKPMAFQATRFNEITDNVIYSIGVARAGIRLLSWASVPMPDPAFCPSCDPTEPNPQPICVGYYLTRNRIQNNQLTNVGIDILAGDNNIVNSNTIRNPRRLKNGTVERATSPFGPLFAEVSAGIWVGSGTGNCINDNLVLASPSVNVTGVALGGYVGQAGDNENYYPCPVTRTSLKENSVIGNCGFGIGEAEEGSIGLWTYYFVGNDFNTFGELVDGPTGVGLPGTCSDTPPTDPQDFKVYNPPFDWPIVPQTC